MKKNKKTYTEYLNQIGIPDEEKKSNGGRIPDSVKYGNWLRKNDSIAFRLGFSDWKL